MHGSDLTLLYNVDTRASILLDQTFGWFWCISGKGRGCKRINWNVTAVDESMPTRSSKLIKALQAGTSSKIDFISHINGLEWTTEKQSPALVALKNRSHPGDRLYLTVDGFIYATPSHGAAVVTECSETYTTTERAMHALMIAIKKGEKIDSKLRIESLKVGTHPGHGHS